MHLIWASPIEGHNCLGQGEGSSRSFSSMRGGTFVVPSLRDGSGKFDDFKRCSNANCRRGRWVRHRGVNQTPRRLPDLPPRPLRLRSSFTHGAATARFLGGLPYCTVCVQSLSAAQPTAKGRRNRTTSSARMPQKYSGMGLLMGDTEAIFHACLT